MTEQTDAFVLQPHTGSRFRREFGRGARSMVAAKWPILALLILLVVLVVAIFGPAIAPMDPNRQNIMLRLAAPMADGPNDQIFLMGSDALGRDAFSRLLYGARVSLLVGVAAILVGGTLGVSAGLVSGYFGGWIDDVLMRLGDIQLAFPFILLAIMFLVVLGPGLFNLILVLGIGQWVTYARIVRAQTLSLRQSSFAPFYPISWHLSLSSPRSMWLRSYSPRRRCRSSVLAFRPRCRPGGRCWRKVGIN